MSSGNRESGDEIIEMKSLFKMLVESQNKQAESLAKLADTQAESLAKLGETQAHTQQQIVASLAKQAESLARLGDTQADTQQQIIEILSRSTNSAGNNQKQQDNASSSGIRKQEIAEAHGNNDEEEP
ncbi:hypothetical protein MKW94_008102, partial [Papaver nudicaule]|nr:hypothetical protein [Papaver nudicaule]